MPSRQSLQLKSQQKMSEQPSYGKTLFELANDSEQNYKQFMYNYNKSSVQLAERINEQLTK